MRGKISFNGRTEMPGRLRDHVSYVGADRAAGLFSNLSVGENLVIRLDGQISRGPLGIRRRNMRRIADQLQADFHIKTAGIDSGIRALSGGNQQKVAIAAAVACAPHVLALEEPTRGVDVSSKREIYEILGRFAGEGGAVVMFCTEVPEVHEVADSVHVVSDGRLSPALLVRAFPDVETLAKAVARLETHAATADHQAC